MIAITKDEQSGDTTMTLLISEQEKGTLIQLSNQAEEYHAQCVKILVEEFGACADKIRDGLFSERALSYLLRGKDLDPPRDAVITAIFDYWPPSKIGLKWGRASQVWQIQEERKKRGLELARCSHCKNELTTKEVKTPNRSDEYEYLCEKCYIK